jgi:hypothetical protein
MMSTMTRAASPRAASGCQRIAEIRAGGAQQTAGRIAIRGFRLGDRSHRVGYETRCPIAGAQ